VSVAMRRAYTAAAAGYVAASWKQRPAAPHHDACGRKRLIFNRPVGARSDRSCQRVGSQLERRAADWRFAIPSAIRDVRPSVRCRIHLEEPVGGPAARPARSLRQTAPPSRSVTARPKQPKLTDDGGTGGSLRDAASQLTRRRERNERDNQAVVFVACVISLASRSSPLCRILTAIQSTI